MVRRIALAVIAGFGVLVGLFWGLSGLVLYVLIALALLGGLFTLSYFGDWITRTSRARFDDDRRRR